MDLSGKNFLVIGGAGLIGSHTVDELIKHDVKSIRIFDNFTRGTKKNLESALKDPRVQIFSVGGDITRTDILAEAVKDVDGVFQFAALWLLHCQDFEQSAFDVNVAGTFNVVQAAIHSNVKRIVYSSSASVYGDAVKEPMDEDHPFNNTNFYGATKIAGESIYRSLYHRHKDTPNAFDYVGLRYMNVYGPRQDYHGTYIAVIMKILDRLASGEPPIVYGDGSQAYDFVYVKDCAKANVKAMQSDRTDEFYNVGTGIKTTIKELAEKLLEETGSNLDVHYEPGGQTFVKNRIGCPKKAQDQLGFSHTVGLNEGLRELIQWRKSMVTSS